MTLPSQFDRDNQIGYGSIPLGEHDLELASLLMTWLRQNNGAIVVDQDRFGQVLRLLAERLASLSVQRSDPSLLVTALCSLVLGSEGEVREALAVAPLVRVAAEQQSASFEAIACAAQEELTETAPGAADLLDPLIDAAHRPLEEMGYASTGQGLTFTFERGW